MIVPSTLRYAFRSLFRNARRTVLSALGLAFGVGVGLIALSWVLGQEAMSINALASGGLGHLRIAPRGWDEHRDDAMRLAEADTVLAQVRSMSSVELATPRARVGGLLGLGTRTSHVTLTGVDATTEQRATRYVSELAEGRYLRPDEEGAIVLGRVIAHRLRAELLDELVVTVVDDHGEMQSAMVTVIGIAETGSRAIDGSIAHIALADLERLSGRMGPSEITMLVRDIDSIDRLRSEIAASIPGHNDVLTWLQVSPEFRARLETGEAFTNLAIGIVLFVVLLGVASAQLTSVLERRKEFAMLAALGMRGAMLVRIVLIEGFVLGTIGGLTAFAWASPILYDWARDGIDLSSLIQSREGLAFGGVLIDPLYYPSFGPWAFGAALSLSLIATLLASLYPAWFASRTDPASALRVDR